MPATTNSAIAGTGPLDAPASQVVVATIRHALAGFEGGRTAGGIAPYVSSPFPRGNAELVTLVIVPAAAANFNIEGALKPIFDTDGALDVGASTWIELYSSDIPGSAGVPIRQTLGDALPYFRITADADVAFTVYVWYLT